MNTMKLEDIANVELSGDGVYKFVVLSVCNPEDSRNQKRILVGKNLEWHHNIVNYYQRSHPELTASVEGGGRIRVAPSELYAYGYSGDYGRADQGTVERLLQEYAQSTGQAVKVEMGKGY